MPRASGGLGRRGGRADVDGRSLRVNAGAGRWPSLLLAVLALALALGVGVQGCGFVDEAGSGLPAPEGAEHRVASLIRAWFSSLEGQSAESVATAVFPVESPLVFHADVGGDPGVNGLRAWIADLRSPYPQVAYRIGAIRIDDAGDGAHRARFELDRRAVDADGIPHVARSAHRWTVAAPPDAPPVVFRIDQEPLLSFPGTGPQVVCY